MSSVIEAVCLYKNGAPILLIELNNQNVEKRKYFKLGVLLYLYITLQ